MHQMRATVINSSVAWASASLTVKLPTVLTHSPDGATSMKPLQHYFCYLFIFSHNLVSIVNCKLHTCFMMMMIIIIITNAKITVTLSRERYRGILQ